MEKRRGFLLTIIIPVLILIMGHNPIMGYNVQKQPDEKGYYFDREVELVSSNFVLTKQKWFVRLIGVLLVFIPFLYFPLTPYYNKKALSLGFQLRYVDNDLIGMGIRKQVIAEFKAELYFVYTIYILLFNALIITLGVIFSIPIFLQTLLIYERVLNFILSFI